MSGMICDLLENRIYFDQDRPRPHQKFHVSFKTVAMWGLVSQSLVGRVCRIFDRLFSARPSPEPLILDDGLATALTSR